MKNWFIGFVTLFFVFLSMAQTQDLGLPESMRGKIKIPKTVLQLPVVNEDSIFQANANLRAVDLNKVLHFGFEHQTNISFFEQAEQQILPNGNTVYLLALECPNAESINLILSQFYLEKGTRLYLSEYKGSDFVGAYTSINNNAAQVLGTEILYSNRILVEVLEPEANKGKSNFVISTVVHGYLNLDQEIAKVLGQSGSCNYDVNCPAGLGWENQRNAVACVVSGGSACSGSLVNNTSGNIIPYYLSANHCGTNPTNWVFRFRWERTAANAICGQTNSTSNNGPTNMTINGGVLRASNSGADFILVELNSAPDPTWGIYYNGWDRSDALTVTSGTGIHHASGDIKKICRENDPLTHQIISFNGDPNTHVWRIENWDIGVTEPGSSGSPLFDQNHRTIGVLSGGAAACNGLNDNNQYDLYGRFGYGWDFGPTADKRLKEWLDPTNTGAVTIDGVDPGMTQNQFDGGILLPTGVNGTSCETMISPSFTIQNNGSETLTSAEIAYNFDGNANQIFSWTGSLAIYETALITLPGVNLNGGNHTFTAEIQSVNGTTDEESANNVISSTFSVVSDGDLIQLDLNLDRYASETSWELKTDQGTVLFSSPAYSDGTTTATTLVVNSFCLESGCYVFTIKDDFQDGMSSNNALPGSFVILSSNGDTLAELTAANANFGAEQSFSFCVQKIQGLDALFLNKNTLVYPNPAKESVQIQSIGNHSIESVVCFDLLGKKVLSTRATSKSASLNTSSLTPGMYVLEIQTSQGSLRKSLVIE